MLFTCGLWGRGKSRGREGENEKQEEMEDFDQRHQRKLLLEVWSD